ncbi:MAG: LPS export ABC transporter permease LptG [Betaproteobacteria bacterium RIFCSPLOWO2_12_FULL_62_58]|nr:MAG: LPS export ABC transporter permease LptG [Betaproteobacteria bacterium RIFCSPLOWO2_02_FULL_62_79]OGA44630.1 MAG: LPS export ABC transporter permease LptG [Betaproteobacteria bacterium RIFCSPLOWO2_12_FULL_62_58]
MRTLRRYLTSEIIAATALVFAALLMLFAFFDLVEQIKDLGRGNYRLRHIVIHVLLSVPNHVYELFPIAALIGTLFALAQLVASSEYTVIRTSGVSLTRMTAMLGTVGIVFALLTFAFGEFIGPPAEQLAQRLRSQAITGLVAQEFRSGLWIKDDKNFINVLEVLPDSTLKGVKVYEFDADYRLRSISFAKRGDYQSDRRWLLKEVVQTTFDGMKAGVKKIDQASWQSVLDPALLSVLLVKPEQMSAWSLYSYAQHLKENRQKALRYEIALWAKIMYPLAVLVMMLLALPFAYFQRRQGGVGAKIFAGIMLGLAFHFLNRLFAHLGLLNEWPPLASATAPTLIFLSVAVAMMWWQERR